LFIDRRSVDIFDGQGRLYMPIASPLPPENQSLKLWCDGGKATIVSLKVYELKSAWR